jgi:hypothetical protein
MIGKLAGDLFDKIALCSEDVKDSDIKDISKILASMKKSLADIEIEDLKEYVQDFLDKWQEPAYLKSDFDSFAGETNELMVELGNEGYFDELEEDEV